MYRKLVLLTLTIFLLTNTTSTKFAIPQPDAAGLEKTNSTWDIGLELQPGFARILTFNENWNLEETRYTESGTLNRKHIYELNDIEVKNQTYYLTGDAIHKEMENGKIRVVKHINKTPYSTIDRFDSKWILGTENGTLQEFGDNFTESEVYYQTDNRSELLDIEGNQSLHLLSWEPDNYVIQTMSKNKSTEYSYRISLEQDSLTDIHPTSYGFLLLGERNNNLRYRKFFTANQSLTEPVNVYEYEPPEHDIPSGLKAIRDNRGFLEKLFDWINDILP